MLHWDRKKYWLWAGNHAQPGQGGSAFAHTTEPVDCGGGNVAYAMSSLIYSRMDFGPHVASFTFLTDVLGDDYVALARCDNFPGAGSGKPCKLEFFEVGRDRRGLTLSGEPSLSIRTPAGIVRARRAVECGGAIAAHCTRYMVYAQCVPHLLSRARSRTRLVGQYRSRHEPWSQRGGWRLLPRLLRRHDELTR